MHSLKISVITVCYNAQATIQACMESVIEQSYSNVEYIVINGASTDDTLSIIHRFKNNIHQVINEPDQGIYDAINKGIALATGDIIGTLNADDFFTDHDVLSSIAIAFIQTNAQIVYGDLNYINKEGFVVRKWRSGLYKAGMYNLGWMPPHPTFYCRSELFKRFGNYSLAFGTAADYELMLRFMHLNSTTSIYLQKVLINMTVGGVSNRSAKNRMMALRNDLKAMYKNQVTFPLMALLLKPLRKLKQFL